MVSNVLEIEPDELVARLEALRAEHGAEAEYQRLRAELPAGWPI